ncbi:uncharacterized protein LAJ45_11249 [Morchella importuna]|uniref:uncharacterized protein n=1 Tax=Morchella importuna TaxID=1174673 RepID=UPI001E8C9FB4|nr:uncharacterized protein LAJ45_11249 [Morchella importuna]KAH8144748.1 hypothetical protein LAJ45_11249 [Morchella importuna]
MATYLPQRAHAHACLAAPHPAEPPQPKRYRNTEWCNGTSHLRSVVSELSHEDNKHFASALLGLVALATSSGWDCLAPGPGVVVVHGLSLDAGGRGPLSDGKTYEAEMLSLWWFFAAFFVQEGI